MTPQQLVDERLAFFCHDFYDMKEYLRKQCIHYLSQLPTEVFNQEVADFLEAKNEPDYE